MTKVPPANLTDSTPVPPVVVNETGGVVSDADAKAWASASNRNSLWYQWAEANVQPTLLTHLSVLSLVPAVELQALAASESVRQPACAIFPMAVKVFSLTSSGSQFFRSVGQPVTANWIMVAHYAGSCQVTAVQADGQTRVVASYPSASSTVFVGHLVVDPALGTILFGDAAASCSTPGAPTEWCS